MKVGLASAGNQANQPIDYGKPLWGTRINGASESPRQKTLHTFGENRLKQLVSSDSLMVPTVGFRWLSIYGAQSTSNFSSRSCLSGDRDAFSTAERAAGVRTSRC